MTVVYSYITPLYILRQNTFVHQMAHDFQLATRINMANLIELRDKGFSNLENINENTEYFNELATELTVKIEHEKDMIASRSLSAYIDHQRVQKGKDYVVALTKRRDELRRIQEIFEHIILEERVKCHEEMPLSDDEIPHDGLTKDNDPVMPSTLDESDMEALNVLRDLKNSNDVQCILIADNNLSVGSEFDCIGEWSQSLCH